MKNSNDTIGNRTRDLPVCSAVPQPTAPPRAPKNTAIVKYLIMKCVTDKKATRFERVELQCLLHTTCIRIKYKPAFCPQNVFVCVERFSQ
jgi:hypothetical protein